MTGAPLPAGRRRRRDGRADPPRRRRGRRSTSPASRPGQNRLTRGREMRAGEVVLAPGRPARRRPARRARLGRPGRGRGRPAAAGRGRPDRRRAGRARPGPRARARSATRTPSMLRALAAIGRGRGRDAADRPRRARGRSRDALAPRARRPTSCSITRRRLGRQRATSCPTTLERPGRRAGLPQGPAQAGQAALVRGRPGAGRGRRARWSSACRATRSAASSASSCSSARALTILAGAARIEPTAATPPAGRPLRHAGDRPTYHPRPARRTMGGTLVEPLDWAGSADLRGRRLGRRLRRSSRPATATYPAGRNCRIPALGVRHPVAIAPDAHRRPD